MLGDSSLDQDILQSVKELAKVLGRPRVCNLTRETPVEVDSPDTESEDQSEIAKLYSVTKTQTTSSHPNVCEY